MIVQTLVPVAITLKEVRKATEIDELLNTICESLRTNRRITKKPLSTLTEELCSIVDNVLLCDSHCYPSIFKETSTGKCTQRLFRT